jgi:hypothetical protein
MSISDLIKDTRDELSKRLGAGDPAGEVGRVLAELEDEQTRQERVEGELTERVRALRLPLQPASLSLLDRPLPAEVDRHAYIPRSYREPSHAEAEHGVVFVYSTANPTFYRAILERLSAGERIRMETHHGMFELSKEEFESALPGIARSKSYRQGSDSAKGSCTYVISRVPDGLKGFRVRR